MKYLLLLAVDGPVDGLVGPPGPDQAAVVARYQSLRQNLEGAGIWCGGEALRPASSVTGVRVRDGQLVLHDGQFVGMSGNLVGYYLVDCDDLDQAIDVSSQIPIVEHGAIEIWPVDERHAAMQVPLRG